MKNLKAILIGGYFVIGLLYAVYSNNFGAYQYRGFAYNFGRGLIWPANMFPSVGHFLGGIIILAVIGYIVMKK